MIILILIVGYYNNDSVLNYLQYLKSQHKLWSKTELSEFVNKTSVSSLIFKNIR